MINNFETPWQGDWQGRLKNFLDSHGHTTLDDFLRNHPTKTYQELACIAKEAHLAPMQLYGEQFRRASANGFLRDAALDALPRFLNEYIKRGWGHGKYFRSHLAAAFSAWEIAVITHGTNINADILKSRLRRITEELERQNPPKGWRPDNPKDSFILKSFDIEWPNEF